ncbi:MAG: hypothetical protein K6B70_01635 [Clostridia bacterium]|nr:hypothetical protein [Clostridia bacterium]
MADFITFSKEEELKSVKGRFSVITVETGPIAVLPEAINVDLYVDGEKQEGQEQIFETSDIGDDILNAELEDKVYICTDAIGLYDKMKECAQMYQDANGNLDVYSDMLDEKLHEDAF